LWRSAQVGAETSGYPRCRIAQSAHGAFALLFGLYGAAANAVWDYAQAKNKTEDTLRHLDR
jgi:hypothetical protein